MNRTIKDATVKVFHCDDLEGLKAHVLAFVTAYKLRCLIARRSVCWSCVNSSSIRARISGREWIAPASIARGR
jgi:hypothetical protein